MFKKKITVRSQRKLDRIKPTTNATIIVAFGTYNQPAIIRRRYNGKDGLNPVKVIGNHYVYVEDDSVVECFDNSKADVFGTANVVLHDDACAVAHQRCRVVATSNRNIVTAVDTSRVSVTSSSKVYAFDDSIVHVYNPRCRVGKVGNNVKVVFLH